jgi:hypothetical protein
MPLGYAEKTINSESHGVTVEPNLKKYEGN